MPHPAHPFGRRAQDTGHWGVVAEEWLLLGERDAQRGQRVAL